MSLIWRHCHIRVFAVREQRTPMIYFWFGGPTMLKSQDCMILLKLLANPSKVWSQRQLAKALCISVSETNAALKRLTDASLVRKDKGDQFKPILASSEEFLINGVKYLFPAKLGEYTRGIPTSVGAPIFRDKIVLGDDPIPIWPDAKGEVKGVALTPIHSTIPKSLSTFPDEHFYEILVLIDAIRVGRAREREIGKALLKKKIYGE